MNRVAGLAGFGWMRGMMCVLALLAFDAPGLAAQRVEGRLLDAETAAPIAGATVVLLDDAGTAVRSALSDSDGRFALEAPGAGVYRLRASRLGYRTGTSAPVDLVGNAVLPVELRLSSRAVQAEPLTVTGVPRSRRLESQGFYERKDQFGPDGLKSAQFLEQEDIERHNPFSVADIFKQDIPGVWYGSNGLEMRRGCRPALFVNGWRTAALDVASPRSVAGIEVYTGLAIPARYLLDANGCGVILLWTK
ncbi:MAG TPA: carboxypeptidase-like regulatory domain-containing protein [Longimicrobium sp.]|nr:carboxypeptidase-like regulatory domain-containing protein [Longimicrobium sp.]